jgi:hypothetical protein
MIHRPTRRLLPIADSPTVVYAFALTTHFAFFQPKEYL